MGRMGGRHRVANSTSKCMIGRGRPSLEIQSPRDRSVGTTAMRVSRASYLRVMFAVEDRARRSVSETRATGCE